VVIVETGEGVETDIKSSHSTFRVPIPIVKIRKHINNFRIIPDLCCIRRSILHFSKSKLFTYNRTTYIRRYSHYHDTPPFMHTFLAALLFTFPMSMRLVIESGERPIRPARWRQVVERPDGLRRTPRPVRRVISLLLVCRPGQPRMNHLLQRVPFSLSPYIYIPPPPLYSLLLFLCKEHIK
jgi:hypothetical protein